MHIHERSIYYQTRLLVMRHIYVFIIAIFVGHTSLGQDVGNNLIKKFTAYQEKISSAKTFLILPKEKYAPGDTVCFTGYFLTEGGKHISGFQILHVHVIDSSGKTVLRETASLLDGVTTNQFVLPSNLTQGIYRIVAYNDYMKPFSMSFFAMKDIKVVTHGSIELDSNSTPPIVAVEGGHLVEGMPNQVAVIAAAGKSVVVKTSNGQDVTSFQTNQHGTGKFLITPSLGEHYVVKIDGVSVSLPDVEKDGCVLRMIPSLNGAPPRFSVDFPESSSWRDVDLVAAVTTNGELAFSAVFKSKKRGPTLIQLPTANLPGGLSQISIVTSTGAELAYRNFYTAPKQRIVCQMETSRREDGRIQTAVQLKDQDGNPVQGQFTVAAIQSEHIESESPTLATVLNLVTQIDHLNSQNSSDPAWTTSLDHLLMAQESRLKWNWIMAEKIPQVSPPPKFIAAKGRMTFVSNNKPVPDSTDVVGYVKNNRYAFGCKTGKDGIFDIAFIALQEHDELFFYAERDGEPMDAVQIEWRYDSIPTRAPKWKTTNQPDPFVDFMTKKRTIDRSYNFFTSKPGLSNSVERKQFDGVLEADLRNTGTTVLVQEYRIFPDMVELLREIIPRLYHRRYGNREIVRVAFNDGYLQPTSSPLYVIDGVMTKRTDYFLALSPADLISVKVIFDPKELSRLNELGKNGIVIVKTKKGNAGDPLANQSTVELNGFSKEIPFKETRTTPSTFRRKPDFRSTIFWNGAVKADASGSATITFAPSDDLPPFVIRVQGVAGGQYFETSTILK